MRAIIVVALALMPFQAFAQLPAECVKVDDNTADCTVAVEADAGQYRNLDIDVVDGTDATSTWTFTVQGTPIVDPKWNGKEFRFRVSSVHGLKGVAWKVRVQEP